MAGDAGRIRADGDHRRSWLARDGSGGRVRLPADVPGWVVRAERDARLRRADVRLPTLRGVVLRALRPVRVDVGEPCLRGRSAGGGDRWGCGAGGWAVSSTP